MDRALSQLERVININNEARMIGLASALLHVWDGPFSHVFEKVISTKHETWTNDIILGDTEINKTLKKIDETFPKKVASVISH
jgi:hypothetical protein